MAVKISQVSFEHHRIALGIGEAEPRISWRFDGDVANWTQSGYTVEVFRYGQAEPQLFHANSSDSVLVPWPTVSFASAESAQVRVRAYGEGDLPDTPWSEAVTVETGLLAEDAWSGAQMIAADKPTEVNLPHQPVLFRKGFSAAGDIEKARLYITAYGVYEAYINGGRVGTAVLAPGWQSYKYRHVYDTYDVTDLLRAGDNAIGIQVGEGWYSGRLGYGGGTRNLWGDTLGAIALLVITSPDGTKEIIRTDDTWSSGTGPIITSELYDGEVYDSRLEQAGWSTPGFQAPDTAQWVGVKTLDAPHGQLVAPDGPPISRIEEIKLQQILTSPTGKTILDFGQNLVGWLRLRVAGPEGSTIKLVHTEVLENGEVATRPLRYAAQTDHFTLSGKGVQVWEPTFTYHGFRYVMVEGWPADDTLLDESSVTAVVVHSDMEATGSFKSSNELINKLHSNVLWSMKGNFMSIPTDCPQRDERLGWTGDAHAFAPTANFLYDATGFWRGWLKDVQFEQVDGAPPVVVPAVPSSGAAMPTAIWGDAVVANPWNTYLASGDLDALREQYTGAKAWLDHGVPRNAAGLWNRSNFQFGDWLDPLAPPDNAGQATTNSSYVADAYLVYVTGLVAQMASELGFEDDRVRYEEWASELKTAFREAWVNPDGTVFNETQTGLALPLYFDLFDGEDEAEAAASRLQKIIVDNDHLVGTGFAGTHLLGLALTKHNLTDTFYKMLLQTTVPSWLYQIEMGATTTWERWDSLLPDGSLNPGEMTSFNHYAVGSVANWIYRVVGGLAPAEPGWKTVKVNVIPGGNFTWAKASYVSPYGRISTEWEVNDAGFHLRLEVPPNTRADVTLPGSGGTAQRVVGSGTHEFSVPGFQA
ncbi:glycoside hydrolase family 78 protein [Durotheca rogersii]|uniref:glycoside hydrolase family 78 protein n=1 Tax=Durotheca rogersii TaxID=419775 RepID=UPI00221ED66F|nr:glycoside hydrolase family 78 protein [Durotheca rogersii]KAI5857457.1 glycoside hydrolase family 78 protein [Durotheca rogersii]